MTRNIDRTPRPGTKRHAAVMTARANPGLTPHEVVRKIAATPEFGGNLDEARRYYIWARDPEDPNTRVNGPYIDPTRFPPHPLDGHDRTGHSGSDDRQRQGRKEEEQNRWPAASGRMSAAQAHEILGLNSRATKQISGRPTIG